MKVYDGVVAVVVGARRGNVTTPGGTNVPTPDAVRPTACPTGTLSRSRTTRSDVPGDDMSIWFGPVNGLAAWLY